jgi:hypothetical protein
VSGAAPELRTTAPPPPAPPQDCKAALHSQGGTNHRPVGRPGLPPEGKGQPKADCLPGGVHRLEHAQRGEGQQEGEQDNHWSQPGPERGQEAGQGLGDPAILPTLGHLVPGLKQQEGRGGQDEAPGGQGQGRGEGVGSCTHYK